MQKYEKLKEEHQQVLTASLRFREEQIERVNRLNELEAEFSDVLYLSLPIFILLCKNKMILIVNYYFKTIAIKTERRIGKG